MSKKKKRDIIKPEIDEYNISREQRRKRLDKEEYRKWIKEVREDLEDD